MSCEEVHTLLLPLATPPVTAATQADSSPESAAEPREQQQYGGRDQGLAAQRQGHAQDQGSGQHVGAGGAGASGGRQGGEVEGLVGCLQWHMAREVLLLLDSLLAHALEVNKGAPYAMAVDGMAWVASVCN